MPLHVHGQHDDITRGRRELWLAASKAAQVAHPLTSFLVCLGQVRVCHGRCGVQDTTELDRTAALDAAILHHNVAASRPGPAQLAPKASPGRDGSKGVGPCGDDGTGEANGLWLGLVASMGWQHDGHHGTLFPQSRTRSIVARLNEDDAGLFQRGLNQCDSGCLQHNPALEPCDRVR